MTKSLSRLIAALLLAVQVSIPVVANDAYQRIPENSLGFVFVRNLAQSSSKVDQLLQPFSLSFPSPLTFAKIVTNLEEGLDLSGDLVVALLPSAEPKADPEPMVLLPISNYEAFAISINADTSGEICRITLLGEDILVAQDGPYAMLMNVEHRQTMEELVALEAEPVAVLAPLQAWIQNQNVALVLMPTGIEQLSNWKREPDRRFGIGFELSRSRSMLSNLLSGAIRPETLGWLRSNVQLAAMGAVVDDESNVRLSQQVMLKENSPLAHLAPSAIKRETSQLGLSNQPLVFAAGGPVLPGWGKRLATLWCQAEQRQIAENGLENIPPTLWDKEEQAYRLLLDGLRSCSVVMLPGEQGEPLLGNFLGVATVADVSAYLQSLPEVVNTWNEMTRLSTSDIKLEVELQPLTVAGRTGQEFVVDIASQAQDPNVPALNWMVESALGPAGKLRVQLLPVDQTTFIFSMATQRQIEELLARVPKDEVGEPQSPSALATLKLLQPAAPWKMLISPQGCLRWASRVANEFLATLSNQEVNIPTMPNSPPIGITVNWIDRQWECEIVCPKDTWKNLASYLETIGNP